MNPWITISGPIVVAGAIIAAAIYAADSNTVENETFRQIEIAEKLGALSTLPDHVASLEEVLREMQATLVEMQSEIATANAAQNERLASIDKRLSAGADLPLPAMLLRAEDLAAIAQGQDLVIRMVVPKALKKN